MSKKYVYATRDSSGLINVWQNGIPSICVSTHTPPRRYWKIAGNLGYNLNSKVPIWYIPPNVKKAIRKAMAGKKWDDSIVCLDVNTWLPVKGEWTKTKNGNKKWNPIETLDELHEKVTSFGRNK